MRNLADVYLKVDNWSDASTLINLSLEVFEAIGDHHWEAATLRSKGDLLGMRESTLQQAVASYRQAYGKYVELGDRPRQVQVLRKIGDLHYRLKELFSARSAWLAALELSEALQLPDTAALHALLDQL
jgi:hypothetical protein